MSRIVDEIRDPDGLIQRYGPWIILSALGVFVVAAGFDWLVVAGGAFLVQGVTAVAWGVSSVALLRQRHYLTVAQQARTTLPVSDVDPSGRVADPSGDPLGGSPA